MLSRDSIANTFVIALSVCAVCSIAVSVAAVGLRDIQQQNQLRDQQKNILLAAGLIEERRPSPEKVTEMFNKIESRLVDLESGEYISPAEVGVVEVLDYDQRKAARDVTQSINISPDQDLAGIGRREKVARVYLVKDEAGEVSQIVLPIYGKGLWSTMYGFIAVEQDMRTVRGLTFYEDAETPGLGGEINSPLWQASWVGKEIFDDAYNVDFRVIKGAVDPESPTATHQVDGLSGATITSKGVQELIRYWFGENGFGPYLERIRREGAANG